MASKPSILSVFKNGQSVGAVDHYVETMNWLIGFVANLKCEKGVVLKNEESDHPSIEAKLIEGDGIKITESDGGLKISLKKNDDDDDDDDDGGGGKKKGSGGSGDGGSGAGGAGGSGGGSGGGGVGAGGSGGGSGGASGSGSGKGTNCNQFSEDLENPDDDFGMGNSGDDCAELNGW